MFEAFSLFFVFYKATYHVLKSRVSLRTLPVPMVNRLKLVDILILLRERGDRRHSFSFNKGL